MPSSNKKTVDRAPIDLYQSVFQACPDYAYVIDKKGVFVDCTPAFLHLLGGSPKPSQKIGALYQSLTIQGLFSAEQVKIIKEKDIQVILSGIAEYKEYELPIVGKEETRYIQFSRIPLLDKEETIMGLLVILHDATEKKYVQEELAKVKHQLQLKNAEINPPLHMPVKDIPGIDSPPIPKILLVEDNVLAQKAAQSLLMNNDCWVDLADNEPSFTEKFAPGKYDLVFMDIGLENTSGYVLAKQIRKLEEGSPHHVPIIALTSFDSSTIQFDCDYYQMEGSITKPLTPEQVNQIIQKYIFKINLKITGMKSVKDKA